jgi:hypothetical protein
VRHTKHGGTGDSRPRYKQHRAVDDRCGVITAVVTTPGDVAEPTQTVALLDQHEHNTGRTVATVVGDQQYGTTDNHRQLQERGVCTHLKTVTGRPRTAGHFGPEQFVYDAPTDRYRCPAGQELFPRRYHAQRQSTEYRARKGVCAACPLRAHCTAAPAGRGITRHREHDLVLRARAQATSAAAKRDYRRRRSLMEGSFAQSANCHGFKRARWRRVWRQQIQDWLIAACQNVKLLLGARGPEPLAMANEPAVGPAPSGGGFLSLARALQRVFIPLVLSPAPTTLSPL